MFLLGNRQIASYRHIKKDLSKRTDSFTYIRVMIYSSTAAWAAANEDWKSVTYRVSVKYWLLFFDTFCAFLHAHSEKNMLNGRWLSFVCKYFHFGFTQNCSTIVLQSLTVNASWVRRFWLQNTFCIFCVQKYKISLTLNSFCLIFLQNMLVLTKIRPKWQPKSTLSVKKETV